MSKMDKYALYLAHILLIGPALVYIGSTYGTGIPKWGFIALLITGLVIAAYHTYLTVKKGVNNGFIYLLHALIFGPVIIYIGLTGVMNKKVFWGAYSVLMMIGFAAIGYHTKKIVDML